MTMDAITQLDGDLNFRHSERGDGKAGNVSLSISP